MKKNLTIKQMWKKFWYFIWEDDSVWSWLANIVLAFVLIKFIVYPGLGFLLATNYPIVAVVSSSMHHDDNFNEWWEDNKQWYNDNNIDGANFLTFPYKNGFNKGDIMILKGRNPKDINIGEILVFKSNRPDPIIHRVVKKWDASDKYYFQTKGDNNANSIRSVNLDETNITEDKIVGIAIFRIPLLGYIKIWFVELINFIVNLAR